MHNNYYFIKQVALSLKSILVGGVVSECFSQNKDELVIRVENKTQSRYIKASLTGSFSCVTFPDTFHRARKNSIDLFEAVGGLKVLDLITYDNERAFAIEFSEDYTLLFKLHGNRSNIILFHHQQVTACFKNNIPADSAIELNTLARKIDFSFDYFKAHVHELEKAYFTFGKLVWLYLRESDFNSKTIEEQWQSIQQLIQTLENPSAYYLTRIKGVLHLSLIPVGEVQSTFNDPIAAVNTFYYQYIQHDTFQQEKTAAISKLKQTIQGNENYCTKARQKITELTTNTSYRTWADLIMANMHVIKQGMEKISLPSFYTENEQVEIKLKKELSPQKNAEAFYRKAKNQHLEIERLQQTLHAKESVIDDLTITLLQIENEVHDLKTLRALTVSLQKQAQEDKPELLPFHEFVFQGYRILVGKHAQANDLLTFKHSYKEDLWLHAKDVAGSHVLIKHQAGKNFPKDVIERAAQLAAYNSKRKTEALCPVIVTPKKFVRKRKGDPAGSVVVEKEDVILVEPRL